MPDNPFGHGAGWTPGPIRTNARTYAQWLVFNGMPADRAASRVAQHADIPLSLATRLVTNAVAYNDRIRDTFDDCATDTKMARSQIYRNPQIPDSYRVIVNVPIYLIDPDTGLPDDEPETWRTLVQDWDHNPTCEEIQSATDEGIQDLEDRGGSGAIETEEETWIGNATIVTIERRT